MRPSLANKGLPHFWSESKRYAGVKWGPRHIFAIRSLHSVNRGGQSPVPGSEEKYFFLSATPSHSLASAGGSRFTVIFGHVLAYSAFSVSHSSRPGSVSGLMASAGHSGSQTPQSMHSSGWMTSMLSPS